MQFVVMCVAAVSIGASAPGDGTWTWPQLDFYEDCSGPAAYSWRCSWPDTLPTFTARAWQPRGVSGWIELRGNPDWFYLAPAEETHARSCYVQARVGPGGGWAFVVYNNTWRVGFTLPTGVVWATMGWYSPSNQWAVNVYIRYAGRAPIVAYSSRQPGTPSMGGVLRLENDRQAGTLTASYGGIRAVLHHRLRRHRVKPYMFAYGACRINGILNQPTMDDFQGQLLE